MPPAFIVVTLQTFASRWYSIQKPFLLYPHHIFLANSVKGSKVQLEKTIKCSKEGACVCVCERKKRQAFGYRIGMVFQSRIIGFDLAIRYTN